MSRLISLLIIRSCWLPVSLSFFLCLPSRHHHLTDPKRDSGQLFHAASVYEGDRGPETSERDNHAGDKDHDEEAYAIAIVQDYIHLTLTQALDVCQILMQQSNKNQQRTKKTDGVHFSDKLQQLFSYCQQAVEAKQSTIPAAGRGLFATQDIPAGTIVSFYPVHAIEANCKDGTCLGAAATTEDQSYFQHDDANSYLVHLLGDRPFVVAASGENNDEECVQLMEQFGDSMINGVAINTNPNRPNVPGWMAHMVNDCATVTTNSERGILDYYKTAQHNCVIVPFGPAPLCVAVTMKAVKSGDELFVSYGYSYWMAFQHASNKSEQPVEKTDAILTAELAVFQQMVEIMQYIEIDGYADESEALFQLFGNLSD